MQPFIDDFKRELPNVEPNFTVTSDHANKLCTASAAGAAPSVSTGWPAMLWTIEAAVQMLDDVINPVVTDIFRRQRNPREGLQEIARLLNAAAAQKRAEIEAFLKAGG